jgi:O-methyltransferase involved in polyketide biosynthesis
MDDRKSKISPTAQPSTDVLGLGRTSGQRGAEIMAGIRAEVTPSPITIALSRTSGRIAARLMRAISIGVPPETVNFLSVRTGGMTALVKEAIKDIEDHLLIVELAAGFSPRGMELAQALPNAEVIEVDLPDVIREKKKRIQKVQTLQVPPNLEWREADLGVVPLSQVLTGKFADAIAAEGLLPYFTPEKIVEILRNIRRNLKPNGVLVCDMAWKKGVMAGGEGSRYLSRQAGGFSGAMNSPEEGCKLFVEAGYVDVTFHLPTVLADKYNLPRPVNDLQFIIVGRNPAPAASSVESAHKAKTDEMKQVIDVKSSDTPKPVDETKPTDAPKEIDAPKPAEVSTQAVEPEPTDSTKPGYETKPVAPKETDAPKQNDDSIKNSPT